jgi:hypothetical protein
MQDWAVQVAISDFVDNVIPDNVVNSCQAIPLFVNFSVVPPGFDAARNASRMQLRLK